MLAAVLPGCAFAAVWWCELEEEEDGCVGGTVVVIIAVCRLAGVIIKHAEPSIVMMGLALCL